MQRVRLGKTGLRVSRVGMGGIPIQRPPLEDAVGVINRALDLGVNFICTTFAYGDSEERIGSAITKRRDEAFLATASHGRDRETARNHLEQSLKRLKTEYVDLWQLHNVTTDENYERVIGPGGAYEAAKEASRLGKVRNVGISTHNMAVAVKAVSSGLFETIQFPFNLIADEAAEELVPLAKEHDVGFISMKPFAAGHIKDANLAIKFLLQFDNVVPDPGVETIEELEEIVGIVNSPWDLTPRKRRAIEEIHEKMESRFCRHCEECLPCPNGVPIPQLLYLTSAYKLRSSEWFRKGSRAHLKSWEKCDLCGDCEEKCPYNLPIREMIAENVEFHDKIAREHPDLTADEGSVN